MWNRLKKLDQLAVVVHNISKAASLMYVIYGTLRIDKEICELLDAESNEGYEKRKTMTPVELYTWACDSVINTSYRGLVDDDIEEMIGIGNEFFIFLENNAINIDAFIECLEARLKSKETLLLSIAEYTPEMVREIVDKHPVATSYVLNNDADCFVLFNDLEICKPDTYVEPDIEGILKARGII